MKKRERVDQVLHERGLAASREQARRLVMAGRVFLEAGGAPEALSRVDKPGRMVDPGAALRVAEGERFVSRGAYKLLTALEYFSLEVEGLVALDAGASTGGFTDCLLQHGAKRVYALDVGRRQLHERLRQDPRVVSLEGVNLRLAPADLIPEPVDMVVADVSFISLTLALPPCLRWLKPDGLVAALIKPQFEAGPAALRKGVVRDPALRQAAVDKVLDFARRELLLTDIGVVPSALRGPKGNQEYMAVWRRRRRGQEPTRHAH
ncbi:MAG: TlyA family RNA methyltransferase [Desulfovibrio sp.]|jgi:23S rRNA (cytidine1920-2'-O)/16S rRNA (cytidine1409-2'-O)-methyltransferase|nr:TlyA family RNA methyltransferase [Desulfovibrio sp.]